MKTHAEALTDWQRRWDIIKRTGDYLERFGMLLELTETLRPDHWERNHPQINKKGEGT